MNTSTDNAPPPRFIDNGDGTITDTQQGVMWTQDTLCDAPVNLETAEELCADCRIGGYSDWVVPDFDPLHSLVDRTRCEPAIDVAMFPDTRYMAYWSRTPVAWAPRGAWIVDFNGGYSYYSSRDNLSAFARACRSLPSGQ